MTDRVFCRDTRIFHVLLALALGVPGVSGSIAMLGIRLVSVTEYVILTICLALVAAALWLICSAFRANTNQPEIIVSNSGIWLAQPYSRPPVEVAWADIAALRMVRSYLSYGPGQLSISVNDAAARRLGLGGHQARPGTPGMTDRMPPRRWHIPVRIGMINESWQQVLDAFEHAAGEAGYDFTPQVQRFGIGSRRLWQVVPRTD